MQLSPSYLFNIFIFPIKLMFSTINQVLSLYKHKCMPVLLCSLKSVLAGKRREENLYQVNGKKEAFLFTFHHSEWVVRSRAQNTLGFLYCLPLYWRQIRRLIKLSTVLQSTVTLIITWFYEHEIFAYSKITEK